jgi:two-component system, chemotaxis family, sensor kinase CheA
MDDFFRKHKDAFLNESTAHIKNMNSALLQLEKNPDDLNLLYDVFRSVHTLKSMAATMNLRKMEKLCHAMEDVLDAIRNENFPLTQSTDILFECFDMLTACLKAVTVDELELDTSLLSERVRNILVNDKEDTQQAAPNKEITLPAIEKLKTIEVKVDRLDTLMKLVEELLVSRIKFELLRESINNHELTAAIDHLGRYITDLQYNVMQVRLVPIEFLFSRFPRMVRDLAKRQHKEIDLKIEGGEIELDRSLIDELGESLTHLIRNAVDHGLETNELRNKTKQTSHSTILLSAKRDKEFVVIEVSDDGLGLDLPKIKEAAFKKNLISSTATNEEVVNSIFRGISTTKKVTSVSGRGLGLSIVKQKIESIGGSIQVSSKAGKGTSFFIRIPLTLAVIRVLFVMVKDQIYAIPIKNIERLLTVTAEDIKGILNFNAIVYQGEDIPVTHLAKLFFTDYKLMSSYPVIVIRKDEKRYGLVVDALLSTQEVVIKPLTKVVKENKYFSGTALIGSGEMVLILDIDQIFLSRRQQNEWRAADAI